jgi:Holliday junction resolvasome RuvABC endonuclease subunit
MRVCSIDPGINLGWAIMDSKDGLLDYGIFRSSASERFAALNEYGDFIQERLCLPDGSRNAEIDAIVCEEVLAGSYHLRTQDALFWTVGTYLQAGCVAAISEVDFHTIHPSTMKKHMAGHGGASKEEVIVAVSRKYGVRLGTLNSHVADSIGLSDCYFSQCTELTCVVPFI